MKLTTLLVSVMLVAGAAFAPAHATVRGEFYFHNGSASITYMWDPASVRYYYIDRGHRHYMHPGWVHPQPHRYERPRRPQQYYHPGHSHRPGHSYQPGYRHYSPYNNPPLMQRPPYRHPHRHHRH